MKRKEEGKRSGGQTQRLAFGAGADAGTDLAPVRLAIVGVEHQSQGGNEGERARDLAVDREDKERSEDRCGGKDENILHELKFNGSTLPKNAAERYGPADDGPLGPSL